MQRLLVLRTFPPFAALDPEELMVVAEYTRERRFAPGQTIFGEDAPVNAIQFIVRGEVELRRHGRRLRTLGPKSAVGGLGVFAREPEGYGCVAVKETASLEISADDIWDIFEDHFVLLRNSVRGIASQMATVRKGLGPKAGFPRVQSHSVECPVRALDLVERMAFLRKAMPFVKSGIEAISDLARDAEEVRASTGTVLWEKDEAAPYVLVLICGVVELSDEEEGQRFQLGPGDAAGSLAAVSEQPRLYKAEVAEDIVALKISIETLHDVFEDNFEMAMRFLGLLAATLLDLYERQATPLAGQSAPAGAESGVSGF